MNPHYSYNPGDIVEDMEVINFSSERKAYLCKCIKCNRTKYIQTTALNIKKGTSHQQCGWALSRQYPELYRCWNHMKQRIENSNVKYYERYGGRGLTHDYEFFIDFYDDVIDSYLEHVKEHGKHDTTLERIDNEKGYIKGNIKWATHKEQASNRCTTIIWKITNVKTNEVFTTNNLKQFCIENNISVCNFPRAYRNNPDKPYLKTWLLEKIG